MTPAFSPITIDKGIKLLYNNLLMIKKVTLFLSLLSFFALVVVTLSQVNTVDAAKGGNGKNKPTSPLTTPITSPKNHGNPHEATFSGVTRIFNLN